jgi:ribonuclease VapC
VIVDSSAIAAIAFDEPERARLIRALVATNQVRIPAHVWLETSLVLRGSGLSDPGRYLAQFEQDFRPEFIPFSRAHADAAVEAWNRFGKGNHPARLNFGDCMSYATARLADEPLLYVGDDFAKTDILSVL